MLDASRAGRRTARDPRLDFFRGVGMFIIFIAHVRDNLWSEFIPARFGFSDATEMFVFCSGMASAIAFGRLYDTAGFWYASGRIVQRIWQVYWSHVGVFLTAIVAVIATDRILCRDGHILANSQLGHFLSHDVATGLFGFMTLTNQPDYFDILPMYLVILAFIPLVMALATIGRGATAAGIVLLWIVGWLGIVTLPANPVNNDTWFFNPFGWQLLFFTGFALMRKWLPPPPVRPRLVWAGVVILVLSLPFSWHVLYEAFPPLARGRAWIAMLLSKHHFGPLRFVHFLALAYLAYAVAGRNGERLRGRFVYLMTLVGRQTLAVFMAGIVLAHVGTIVLDEFGRSASHVAVVNGAGLLGLVLTALVSEWFKSAPWLQRHAHVGHSALDKPPPSRSNPSASLVV